MVFLATSRVDHVVAQSVGKLEVVLVAQIIEMAAKFGGIFFLFPRFGCLSTLLPFILASGLLYFVYEKDSRKLLSEQPRKGT
jgi:hypothetical protein